MRLIAMVLMTMVAACVATVRPLPTPTMPMPRPAPIVINAAPTITVHAITSVADVPTAPIAPGAYRIYAFDVGTGLAMLVQGADFALLYDGGSNDAAEDEDRVLAFLFATIGPSGGDRCVPAGDAFVASPTVRRIDHVMLSHPHQDHGSALARVLQCYQVANIWDAGAINDAAFYRAFIAAVADEAGASYHTALGPTPGRVIDFPRATVVVPPSVTWRSFSDGDVVELGGGARMTILNADGKPHRDRNANSIVVRVDLGTVRALFTGDAGSGKRADPSAAVDDLEAALLAHHAAAVDVDILQVGHHGSMTSSRAAFLAAISPRFAIISSGPRKYGRVVLPDAAVVTAVTATGATILRTDLHDSACPTVDHIGLDDRGPGGCDSYLLDIAPGR